VATDPLFDTVKEENWDSYWQLKAGFTPQREKVSSPNVMLPTEGGTNPPQAATERSGPKKHRLAEESQDDTGPQAGPEPQVGQKLQASSKGSQDAEKQRPAKRVRFEKDSTNQIRVSKHVLIWLMRPKR
jgi:hypothetical protein